MPEWVRKGDATVALTKGMLDMAARVIGDRPTKKLIHGTKRGTIGTAFAISVPSATHEDVRYGYVLTAHHVIDGQREIEVQFSNPFAPGELWPPMKLSDWRVPLEGVDLVVCPVPGDDEYDQNIQGCSIERQVLHPSQVPALGAPAHYIGYLEPYDRIVVRTGTIAALEQTGLEHCQPEYDYECHLVDCRSYVGFSGSPCFFRESYPILTEVDRDQLIGDLPDEFQHPIGRTVNISVLCGMLTEHSEDRVPNEDGVVSRYGIGVLLPSREIWRALMTDEMKKERKKWDEEREAREDENGPAFRATGIGSGGNEEYDRFEELARELANTPKSKPDEEPS